MPVDLGTQSAAGVFLSATRRKRPNRTLVPNASSPLWRGGPGEDRSRIPNCRFRCVFIAKRGSRRVWPAAPTGMTIAVVLLEHVWMLPLLQAIERAEGFELKNEWVDAGTLAAIGAEAAARDQP